MDAYWCLLMIEKRQPYRNKKILDAAKGERCTVNFVQRCSDPETTVFAHFDFHWAGKGFRQKSDDHAGVFACHACHEAIGKSEVDDFFLLRAYYRTIRRLFDKGVIK